MRKRIGFGILVLGLMTSGTAQAADIEWNGFGSLYYAQALEKNLLPPSQSDRSADFSTFSLFGLNVGGRIDEKFSVAAQLIAASQAATGTWGMYANWAYLNYKPVDAVTVKLGRQLFPVFIGSEYDKVGQLLPYRRIPAISTLSPFSGFDGLSAAYQFNLSDSLKFTASGFGGRPIYELTAASKASGFTGTANDLLGATATLDGPGYRIRAAYTKLRATLKNSNLSTTCSTACSSMVDLYSVGYRVDKYNIVSWGEMVYREGNKGTRIGTTDYLHLLRGGYALLGYRIGDFLPRYTFTRSDALIGVGTGGYDSHTVGLNYALSTTATLKVDYEMFKGMSNGVYGLSRPTGSTERDGSAVYAGVDFIF